ncbi:TonB-dependent siderophore receptor, partial [Pseudomonas sp. MWU13-2625]
MATSGAMAAEAAAPAPDERHALPAINVSAHSAPADPLTQPLETGSRLGRASLDTPASDQTATAAPHDARGDPTALDPVPRTAGFPPQLAPAHRGRA